MKVNSILLLLLLLSTLHSSLAVLNFAGFYMNRFTSALPVFSSWEYQSLLGGVFLLAALFAAQYGYLPIRTAPIVSYFDSLRHNRRQWGSRRGAAATFSLLSSPQLDQATTVLLNLLETAAKNYIAQSR